jgi:hypothetical protein
MSFRAELQALINRHSLENVSNTPDHVLANFLGDCLRAFNEAVRSRDVWYGVELRPGWRAPELSAPEPGPVSPSQP